MARIGVLALLLPAVHGANNAVNQALLRVENELQVLETTNAQQNPLAFLWAFMSIIIFCICSYLVYKWHNEMKENGQEPKCGIKSAACCICCCCGCGTFLTICFPIDAGKEKSEGEEKAEPAENA